MSPPVSLAPCVAVVGPANSGKSTFLNQLDHALQNHPAKPSVHVVKGSPDGSGRYLFHAPKQREKLKARVKGQWQPGTTADVICAWIDHARQSLELALLDFGGKHDSQNDRMLSRCSHYIALCKRLDDPAEEAELTSSWIDLCERNGLTAVAVVRSFVQEHRAEILSRPNEAVLRATYRSDAATPDDPTNLAVIEEMISRLLELRAISLRQPYLDLNLRRNWQVSDLDNLGGLVGELEALLHGGGPLRLGGRAPMWAYAAVMHRALTVRGSASIAVFDPKIAGGWVRIPETIAPAADGPLSRALKISWIEPVSLGQEPRAATLDLIIGSGDHFLAPALDRDLAATSLPPGAIPQGAKAVSGPVPIWLHLTYSRWLRTLPEAAPIGIWDAGLGKNIWVHFPKKGVKGV